MCMSPQSTMRHPSLPDHSQRSSMASRISSIFERRRVPVHDVESARATTTFEVPLFLSPARYGEQETRHEDHLNEDTRSRTSTQSPSEAAVPTDRNHPSPLTPSSRYSSQVALPVMPQPTLPSTLPREDPSSLASTAQPTRDAVSRAHSRTAAHQRQKRRDISRKAKILALRRLRATFGLTLVLTSITYLSLAITGTGVGVSFHVLMILLVLSLAGVFAYCIWRLFFLAREAKSRPRTDGTARHQRGLTRSRGAFFGEIQPGDNEHIDDIVSDKPVRITIAEEEEEDEEEGGIADGPSAHAARQPPPVYGNFRSSQRIDPHLVHWQKVPPSPLTPTYAEAVSSVHRAVGYRPPSYKESENGAADEVGQSQHEIDRSMMDIHPLERERVINLR